MYWSFSISPSNEYSGLIFFRIDQFDFIAVQGTLKSLLQHHNSKHQVFGAQSSLGSNSHITTWYLSFFHFFSFPLCFLSFSPLSLLPPLPPPSLLSFLHFPYWFPLALQVFRAELGLQTHRSTFCALEGALQVNKHDWMSVELSKI